MKCAYLLIWSWFFAPLLFALEKTPSEFKLNLSEHVLTTSIGVILPSEIIKLQINDEIKISIPDGTTFRGIVTKTNFKDRYHYECLGEINNHPNTGFGFVVTKDGIYGAIVMRETDTIFYVKYSEEANGFILLRQITPTVRL